VVWEDANKFNRGRLKSLIESWYGGIPYSGMVFNEEEPFHEIEDQKKVPKDKSKNDWFSDPKGHLATDNLDILNRYKREKSLYTNIYAPYCQTCHVLQKTDWSNAVDFNNAAFKLICEQQKPMPQAEITNHRFKTDTIEVEHSETITTPFQELCSQAVPTTESDGTRPSPPADDPANDNSEDGSLPPPPNLSDTDSPQPISAPDNDISPQPEIAREEDESSTPTQASNNDASSFHSETGDDYLIPPPSGP